MINDEKDMLDKENETEMTSEEETKQESCSSCMPTGSDCGKYLSYVLIGLGFLLLYNIAMLWNTGDILETKINAMEAAAIPLDVQLLVLNAQDCDQ